MYTFKETVGFEGECLSYFVIYQAEILIGLQASVKIKIWKVILHLQHKTIHKLIPNTEKKIMGYISCSGLLTRTPTNPILLKKLCKQKIPYSGIICYSLHGKNNSQTQDTNAQREDQKQTLSCKRTTSSSRYLNNPPSLLHLQCPDFYL